VIGSFDEALDLEAGTLDLDALAERVEQEDLDVAVLTDEELHWLGPDADRDPTSLDAPRLAQMTPDHRAVALEAVLMLLHARGEVELGLDRDDDEDAEPEDGAELLVPVSPTSALVDLRTAAPRRLLVRVDDEEGTERVLVHLVDDGLVLVEDVLDEGLHEFTISSPVRTAAVLATMLTGADVVDVLDEPAPLQVVRAASRAGLDPSPDALHDDADVVASLLVADGVGAELEPFGTVTVGEQGTHLVHAAAGADGTEVHTLSPLTPAQLAAVLATAVLGVDATDG
jgi:hypothetical protein